jgi:hypothetical protein
LIVVSFTAFHHHDSTDGKPTRHASAAACLAAVGGAFFPAGFGAPESLRPRRGMARREIQWLTAEDWPLFARSGRRVRRRPPQLTTKLSSAAGASWQDIPAKVIRLARLAGFSDRSSQRLGNPTWSRLFTPARGWTVFAFFNLDAALSPRLLVRLVTPFSAD